MILQIEEHEMPALIAAAVNRAWPIGEGVTHPRAGHKMTLAQATLEWAQDAAACRRSEHIPAFVDYLWGRRLKLEWNAGWVDSTEYDSCYGEGALALALDEARRPVFVLLEGDAS